MTPTDNTHTARKLIGWSREYRPGREPGERFRSFVAELDGNGNVLRETDYFPDGKLLVERQFTPPGRLAEERHYDSDGTLNFKNELHYDAAGRKTETVMHTAGGETYGKWICHYGGTGKLERETWVNRQAQAEVEDNYDYRDGGRTVIKTRGNVAAWTSTYDAKGKLLTVRGGYFSADQADDAAYEYDDRGRLTKKTEYSSPGVVGRITDYSEE